MSNDRVYQQKYKAYQRAKWKDRGRCRQCGGEVAVNEQDKPLTLCPKHRERQSVMQRKYYEKRDGRPSAADIEPDAADPERPPVMAVG